MVFFQPSLWIFFSLPTNLELIFQNGLRGSQIGPAGCQGGGRAISCFRFLQSSYFFSPEGAPLLIGPDRTLVNFLKDGGAADFAIGAIMLQPPSYTLTMRPRFEPLLSLTQTFIVQWLHPAFNPKTVQNAFDKRTWELVWTNKCTDDQSAVLVQHFISSTFSKLWYFLSNITVFINYNDKEFTFNYFKIQFFSYRTKRSSKTWVKICYTNININCVLI